MNTPKDTLFSTPREDVVPFVFDAPVADVFEDMISRSVPGYRSVIQMCGLLARRFANDGLIYDLGCSRGATLEAMAKQVNPLTRLIGIDNSAPMIERLQADIRRWDLPTRIDARLDNVLHTPLDSCQFITINWTLQFIAPADRAALIERVFKALKPGGALVLSEKITATHAEHHEIQNQLHTAFKRSQGYSELEIAQKRDAIENVLIPESHDQHTERLLEAGFKSVEQWFRCFNFASFIALK